MSLNNEKIFRFDENREKEKIMLMEELEKIERELEIIKKEEMRLFDRTMTLDNQKDTLRSQLERLSRGRNNSSQHNLYNFNREELIRVLDDFIQYKDYFENPPEEAYEMDDWDYCKCKEAKDIEQLLYKYEIHDTKYIEKLPIMKVKYNKETPAELSGEELMLDEILVILTWLHRHERWCGGAFNEAIKDGTFYNLLKRMEEIRNEL